MFGLAVPSTAVSVTIGSGNSSGVRFIVLPASLTANGMSSSSDVSFTAVAAPACWKSSASSLGSWPASDAQGTCRARWRGPAGGRPPDTELGLAAISAAKFHSMHRPFAQHGRRRLVCAYASSDQRRKARTATARFEVGHPRGKSGGTSAHRRPCLREGGSRSSAGREWQLHRQGVTTVKEKATRSNKWETTSHGVRHAAGT